MQKREVYFSSLSSVVSFIISQNESLQCPTCKLIYGEKTGICPAGVMKWTILHGTSVAGYEGYDTISVSYHIEPGVQVSALIAQDGKSCV